MSEGGGTSWGVRTHLLEELPHLLGVPRSVVTELVELAWDEPRTHFSERDVTLLRTARGLLKRGFSRVRLARALARLESELEATLSQEGRELVADDGAAKWNAETGQGLLSLRSAAERPEAQVIRLHAWRAQRGDPERLFARAVAEETEGANEAVETYSEVVALDPRHADAHVNLGRLLHQRGRLKEAEAHYVAALVSRPDDVTATFNLAVVLDDQGRLDDAIAAYRQALELDPGCLDAYFNLSRLYEKKGEKVAAIRHLKDYRRLAKPS